MDIEYFNDFYFLTFSAYTWNMVRLADNNYYYLDTTYMDCDFKIYQLKIKNDSYNELLKEYKRVNTIDLMLVEVTGGLSVLGFIAFLNIYRKELFSINTNN